MGYRDYKNFEKGQFYHIFNRGNNKENTFIEAQDYNSFLKRLKIVLSLIPRPTGPTGTPLLTLKPLPPGSFTIYSYCLMPNHFHLLIKQNGDTPISKLLLKVCTSYSYYFNKKYKRVGHVFQDQFKAKLVENDIYFTYLTAYIHNNPPQPLLYEFSSFQGVLGIKNDILCDKTLILSMFGDDVENYKKFVIGFSKNQEGQIEDLLID